MICPHCGRRSRVWKTREAEDGRLILRERRCQGRGCRALFLTEERVKPGAERIRVEPQKKPARRRRRK